MDRSVSQFPPGPGDQRRAPGRLARGYLARGSSRPCARGPFASLALVTLVVLTAAAALLLTACSARVTDAGSREPTGVRSPAPGTLTGVGATSMATVQEAWAARFQTAHPDVTVDYSPDGSGAGREALIGGAADFAGSDVALSPPAMTPAALARSRCEPDQGVLNLPVYVAPIAIVYRVPGVSELNLEPDTLAGILAGRITRWDDPRIAAANADATLPDQAIVVVHRADDSGTTQNLTEYLSAVAPSGWPYPPAGRWPIQGGEAAAQSSGMIDAVSSGTGTIGYADASRADGLAVATIKVGGGFAAPTAAGAVAVLDASTRLTGAGRSPNDWTIELDRTTTEGYPLTLLSYAIVCQRYADPQTGARVRAYVGYLASQPGQQAAAEATRMARLPPALTAQVAAAAATIS